MIVDTSAVLAMLRNEEEAKDFAASILGAESSAISAVSYGECAAVLDSARDAVVSARLDELLQRLEIAIAPVTASQAVLARTAWNDFGPGSDHPARFDFGDCYAYALAMERGQPLLATEDKFTQAGLEELV